MSVLALAVPGKAEFQMTNDWGDFFLFRKSMRNGKEHGNIYPIGSMYAIYGNIYHQYTPNVSIYIPYMDPMGMAATALLGS